jgi:hypothetical protein
MSAGVSTDASGGASSDLGIACFMGTVFFFFIRFLLFELWGVVVFASGGAAPFVSPRIFRAIVFTPFAYLMMVKTE